MVIINLTPEQAQLMQNTQEEIYLHDPLGKTLGYVKKLPKETSITAEEIEEYRRRAKSPGPWYTFEEVLAKLKALEAESR